MVAALGMLPQMSEGAIQSDFPLIGELDREWYYDAACNKLRTDPVVAIGGQHNKWQQCQGGCASLLEGIVTPEIELGAKVEATDTGLMENSERVGLSGAYCTVCAATPRSISAEFVTPILMFVVKKSKSSVTVRS